MARTVGDIPTGGVNFPPVGKHLCTVINVTSGKSAKKQTPQIEVAWSNGEMEFPDQLYITDKTLSRLCMFAMRVCGMSRTEVLPDEDMEAVKHVANFIMKNTIGKKAFVNIDEKEEKFVPESGPDAGRMKTVKRRRVAFPVGYEEYKEPEAPQGDMQEQPPEEQLPF